MIGEVIEMTEEMVRYDAACKMILSQKVVLSWILKQCTEEFKSVSIEEICDRCIEREMKTDSEDSKSIIWGLNTEDVSLSEGKTIGDIRFSATTLDGKKIIFDIEAQNEFPTEYPLTKRGYYYLSRMISEQRGREFEKSHYEGLKKAILIWVCLKPPKKWRNAITQYEITEESVIGDITLDPKEYDLITQIIIGLGDHTEPEITEVLRLLDMLFSNDISADEKKRILRETYHIEMDNYLERGVEEMCNFSIAIKREALEEGMEKGMSVLNRLYAQLVEGKRFDELERATKDELFRNALMSEYGLTLNN